MTNEQIRQLIDAIEQLGNNRSIGNEYMVELSLLVISAAIAFLFAFFVARYQVNKSNDQLEAQRKKDIIQQEKYREEDQLRQEQFRKDDIERQKQFMIDELKLKTTEKLLEATAKINQNILQMMELSYERYDVFLRIRGNRTKYSSRAVRINLSIQEHYDEIQTYLSTIFTFTELFDVTREKIDIDELKKINTDLFNVCIDDEIYTDFEDEVVKIKLGLYLEEQGQNLLRKINDSDYIVRAKQVELISNMKNENL